MLPLQYDLPSRDEVEKCHITKDFIENKEEVKLEFMKKKKEAN